MNPQETEILMRTINVAYPEFNRDVDTDVAFELWFEALRPYSYEICKMAVGQHILECKFAPKISEIIDRVKAMMPALPEKPRQEYMSTEWERRSMRNLVESLGIKLDPDIAKLVYIDAYGNPMDIPAGVLKEPEQVRIGSTPVLLPAIRTG